MRKIRMGSAVLAVLAWSSCGSLKQSDEDGMPAQQAEAVFPKGNKISSSHFTGTVWLHMIPDTESTLDARMGNVTFEPGARTNWHAHPGGQILLIMSGVGCYQEKDKPARLLRKGDIVQIPPNSEHWHGAAPDSSLSHISISLNTDKGDAVWLRPVTEEEYGRSTQSANQKGRCNNP